MHREIRKLPESEIEIEVELSTDEMRPHLLRAAADLSKEKPIEGFRPGKAPYDIAAKRFGEMKIYERALNDAINAAVPKILDEEGIRIVGRPEVAVKKIAPGNPTVFSLKTAIIPEFNLPDFESIAKKVLRTKENAEVKIEEINEVLARLQRERAENKKVARPAQKGDLAEIDFSATRDGKEVGGGPSRNHLVLIGQGAMVPGFEDELIGMAENEEKTFSLLVPENHRESSIAGETLDFTVKVRSLQERIAPELDDQFAKTVGNFENLTILKASIAEGLLREKEEKERNRARVAAIDAVADETEMTIPEVMADNELEKMLLELRENIASMSLRYEDYLTHLKKSEADLKHEWRDEARRRVKIALILRAIAKAKNIQPDNAAVKETANRLFSRLRSPEEAQKQIDLAALDSYAKGIARNEAVFRYIETLS